VGSYLVGLSEKLGCKGWIGPKQEGKGGGKGNVLQIFKRIQTNEFKHRFEFNQSKIVLQHVCNNKLLWFINLIEKNYLNAYRN
jgi:hypothetical protein